MAFSATFIYEIIDKYSPVIRKVTKATDAFRYKMLGAGLAMKSAGSRMQQFSIGLANLRTGLAAIGFTRGFINVTNSAFEFQKSLNAVESKTFGTRLEMKKLEKQALSLGASTIFTSGQVADGMKFLAQTGFETNQIFGLMPKMLTLAAAGDLQLAEAADIATNVLRTFGLEIGEMGRVTDVLALASSRSNTDIRQLAQAMRNAGSIGKNVGVDIEELSALIGVLGDKGIQAGHAGTLLMNAFRMLASEAPKVQKGLLDFGLKKKDILTQSGQLKDFTGLLKVLGEKGATVGQLFNIFNIRGGKAVVALKDSAMSVRQLNIELDAAKGTADKMAEIMLKHGVGNIVKMKSAFDNMKISIGLALMPMTIALANIATKVTKFVSKYPKLAKFIGLFLLIGSALSIAVVGLGVIIGLVAAYTSAMGAAAIATAMTFLPYILIGAAIAAAIGLAVYLYKRFENIRKVVDLIGGFYLKGWGIAFKIIWGILKAVGKLIIGRILRPFKLLDDVFGILFDKSMGWGDKLKAIGKLILDFILAPFKKIMDLWDNLKIAIGGGANGDINLNETNELLTSNATEPAGLAAGSQKTTVEHLFKFDPLEINDRSGMASTQHGGGGGVIPVNMNTAGGYQF